MNTLYLTSAVFFTLTLVACGEDSREERANNLANKACDRYETCVGYGTDKTFATRADCEIDYKAKALDLWPNDQCGDGRINDDRYTACLDRVKVQACSQSFFDSITALNECKPSTVCIDSPN